MAGGISWTPNENVDLIKAHVQRRVTNPPLRRQSSNLGQQVVFTAFISGIRREHGVGIPGTKDPGSTVRGPSVCHVSESVTGKLRE